MKTLLMAFILSLLAGQVFAAGAVIKCNINYTSPDGTTTVNAQNQRFQIPLSNTTVYMDTMNLGPRRLDVSAEDLRQDGWQSLTITLWRMNYPGVLCEHTTGGGNIASCLYANQRTNERVNIQCQRVQ